MIITAILIFGIREGQRSVTADSRNAFLLEEIQSVIDFYAISSPPFWIANWFDTEQLIVEKVSQTGRAQTLRIRRYAPSLLGLRY